MTKHLLVGLLLLVASGVRAHASAGELASFTITEPLGRSWNGDWLTQTVTVDLGERELSTADLRLVGPDGKAVPAQVLPVLSDGRADWRAYPARLSGRQDLHVHFRVDLPRGTTQQFRLTDEGPSDDWTPVTVEQDADGRYVVSNGHYRAVLDPADTQPISELHVGDSGNLVRFGWPEGVEVQPSEGDLDETHWYRTPAFLIVTRSFQVPETNARYTVLLRFRAHEAAIGYWEYVAPGWGIEHSLVIDCSAVDARQVDVEASRPPWLYRQRPEHRPLATVAPLRIHWYNAGSYAFLRSGDDAPALGIAAVSAPTWTPLPPWNPWVTEPDVPVADMDETCPRVWGDVDTGQLRIELPLNVNHRRLLLLPGRGADHRRMAEAVRRWGDLPLAKILEGQDRQVWRDGPLARHVAPAWVLDWATDAPEHSFGLASQWYGGFNRVHLGSSGFPRRVLRHVDELLREGRQVKSPDLAALAYIFTDPDYWPWPGYAWNIGNNPNYHTDMYSIPFRIGLAMRDHPHAERWVRHGLEQTHHDLHASSYPGGAWAESLGYATYVWHVVDNARLLRDHGLADPFADWPRLREVVTYKAIMHTPTDPRYGRRQIAPIGDTGPGDFIRQIREVAGDYEPVDPAFAEQLRRFPEAWEGALDLSSRALPGFGAMLRGSPYDERRESFVTVKAGPARNHFAGDELSFHFCSLSTPLAIDYASHYSPRGWSTANQNRPGMGEYRPVTIAQPLAFETSPVADVFVAIERTTRLQQIPMEPHRTLMPAREYPTIELDEDEAWMMGRATMLVKHDANSPLADYLVVADRIRAPRPIGWNLHMLARDISVDGQTVSFPGQLGVDCDVHFLVGPDLREEGRVEKHLWGWHGDAGRRRSLTGEDYERDMLQAMIPEDFEPGTWGRDGRTGELAQWLRVTAPAGESRWLVVLMPRRAGEEAPRVERLSDTSFRVSLGEFSETIHLGEGGTHLAAVERNGRLTVLIPADRRLDPQEAPPLPPRRVVERMENP